MEMSRHENALHYQNFALAPLAMIAELAARQGVDLYSLRVNGHTFLEGVNFLIKASTFPDVMKRYATEKQTFSLYSGDQQLAWLEFWVKRHPAPFWGTVLTRPLFDSRIGGNATLYAAPTR
jgi:poly(beta-D-mannuronate) lyase